MKGIETKTCLAILALCLLCFYGLPILYLLLQSVNGDYGTVPTLENYALLESDRGFHTAILLTLGVVVAAVFLQITLALTAAVLACAPGKLPSLLARVMTSSYFIPTSCFLMLWLHLSNPFTGPLSSLLNNWQWELDLRGEKLAPVLSALFSTVEGLGFCFLVFYARLHQIPAAHFDLACQYGGGMLSAFWHIFWPQLRSTVLTLIVLRAFISFAKFDAPWLAFARIRASPWGDTFGIWVYRNLFETARPGLAAAGVVVFMLILFGGALKVLSGPKESTP